MTLIFATFCKTRTNAFIQGRPICSNFQIFQKVSKNSIFDQLLTSTPAPTYPPPPPPPTYITYPLTHDHNPRRTPVKYSHPPNVPPLQHTPPPSNIPPPQRIPPNVHQSPHPQRIPPNVHPPPPPTYAPTHDVPLNVTYPHLPRTHQPRRTLPLSLVRGHKTVVRVSMGGVGVGSIGNFL